jgi:hypothetical protein
MSAFLFDVPSIFSGGSGSPLPQGAPVVAYPFKEYGNYSKVYSQDFVVHSGAYSMPELGSPGIFPNTYFVGESDRQPLAGGYYQFSRDFAELPSGFNDYSTLVYTFPALQTWRPLPRVATVTARIWNDFFLTGAPQNITLSGAQVWRNVYGFDSTTLSAITTPTATAYSGMVGSGIEFLPQDSQLARFVGPIFRRSTYYVKAQ